MEKVFATIYWEASNLLHSQVLATKRYLRETEKGLAVNCYPSPSNEHMIPVFATQSFLTVIAMTIRALELDLEGDFQEAMKQFQAIL